MSYNLPEYRKRAGIVVLLFVLSGVLCIYLEFAVSPIALLGLMVPFGLMIFIGAPWVKRGLHKQ